MRTPRDVVVDLARSYEREAEKLERVLPALEARRTVALLVSQRVVDKLQADVAASDAERSKYLAAVLPELVLRPERDFELETKIEAVLKARELALVEVFSDRVIDFAEEAKAATVAATARAKVLRETVVALRAVESASEDSGRVDAATPEPEPAEAPPAPEEEAHDLLEGGAGLPEPSGGVRFPTPADDQVYGPGPSLDSSTVYRGA